MRAEDERLHGAEVLRRLRCIQQIDNCHVFASDTSPPRALAIGAPLERIAKTPVTAIEVAEITDASVKLYLRPWTSVESYQPVATETMEKIKTAMESAGLKYSVTIAA